MRNYLLLILSILFMGYLPVLGQSDSAGLSSKNFFMEEDSVKPDFLLLLVSASGGRGHGILQPLRLSAQNA